MKNSSNYKYISQNPKTSSKSGFKSKIKNSLNKILFWVIIGGFCLFTLGSTLGTIAFFKTANADSVEETAIYQGNSLFLPTNTFSGSSMSVGTGSGRGFMLTFDYILSVEPKVDSQGVSYNNLLFQIRAVTNAGYPPLSVIKGYDVDANNNYVDVFYPIISGYSQVSLSSRDLGQNRTLIFKYDNVQGYYDNYASCSLYFDDNFNGDVVSVRMYGTDRTATVNGLAGYYYVRNTILLTDSNGNIFRFGFDYGVKYIYSSLNNIMLDDRIYYNSNNFSSDSNFLNGKNQGYLDGKKDGEQIGYDKGYDDGKNDGLEEGRIEGINQAGNYTLYSLISSIFNVPLVSFVHLINFEFFGVNLANFFTGCLTVGVILFIVSKLFGK